MPRIFPVLTVALTLQVAVTQAMAALTIAWTNNLLTVNDTRRPGAPLEIWYLEAFCRSGAWNRDWNLTTLPHKTTLVRADASQQRLEFHTVVEPGIEVWHQIQAGADELDLQFDFTNTGPTSVDLQWFEPACIRVASFTGCQQSNYTGRSFIFTSKGKIALDQLRRTTNGFYQGGQVYLPPGIRTADANPRAICLDHPANGLIGCVSADSQWLLATASDRTHELFEGVYVCLHSDPRLDGLAPGEHKHRRAKIYLVPNNTPALVARYRHDFPGRRW